MDELRNILDVIGDKLSEPQLDIAWTNYDSPDTLRQDFNRLRSRALSRDTEAIKELHVWFLPTSTLQELSLDNGWGDEFCLLASRFDKAILDLA